jgi:hypothetical protein
MNQFYKALKLTRHIGTSSCSQHAPQLSKPGVVGGGLHCGVDVVGLNILNSGICRHNRYRQISKHAKQQPLHVAIRCATGDLTGCTWAQQTRQWRLLTARQAFKVVRHEGPSAPALLRGQSTCIADVDMQLHRGNAQAAECKDNWICCSTVHT